jgi:hypothetical protein
MQVSLEWVEEGEEVRTWRQHVERALKVLVVEEGGERGELARSGVQQGL